MKFLDKEVLRARRAAVDLLMLGGFTDYTLTGDDEGLIYTGYNKREREGR